jgi:hypothetical protein
MAQDSGSRVQDTGFRIQDTGYKILDTGLLLRQPTDSQTIAIGG